MAADPEPSGGSSSTDSGEERRPMDFVKWEFSVLVCKCRPAWHMDGHLSYVGGVGFSSCFCSFSGKRTVFTSVITIS